MRTDDPSGIGHGLVEWDSDPNPAETRAAQASAAMRVQGNAAFSAGNYGKAEASYTQVGG